MKSTRATCYCTLHFGLALTDYMHTTQTFKTQSSEADKVITLIECSITKFFAATYFVNTITKVTLRGSD